MVNPKGTKIALTWLEMFYNKLCICSSQPASAAGTSVALSRPVERQVEARPSEDALSSMVRCLTLENTFIVNRKNASLFFHNLLIASIRSSHNSNSVGWNEQRQRSGVHHQPSQGEQAAGGRSQLPVRQGNPT